MLIVSLFLLPPVLCAISHVLFWCFCWCFCTVDNYFQDRFMQRIALNMKHAADEREAA